MTSSEAPQCRSPGFARAAAFQDARDPWDDCRRCGRGISRRRACSRSLRRSPNAPNYRCKEKARCRSDRSQLAHAGQRLRSLRRAAGLLMGDARGALAAAVAIVGAFAGCEKGLPGNAGRIVDPGFFRLGVAAAGLPLLDDIGARLMEARVDLFQFVGIIGLNAEMIETG